MARRTRPGRSSSSRSPRAAGSRTTPNACASSRARRSPTSSPARSAMAIAALPARIAGDAIGADAHLGNMATEEFLCLPVQDGDRTRRIEPERPAAPARQGYPRRRHRRSSRLDLHPPGSAVRPLRSRNRSPLGSPARLFGGLPTTPTTHRTRRPKKRMEPLERRMIPSDQSRKPISTT